MKLKNKYVLYIAFITVVISCSSKKASYEQKIEAPLDGNGLAFDLVAYKQDTSIRITTPKGTVIDIEPNTFTHANGTAVTNQIIIKVREMHTPIDIFKSGIPMSLDASRINFLQSVGMLEIRAFDNKEELILTNGKSIGVELANFNPSSGYSLYHLQENRNWQVTDTFIVQKNDRKARALDKVINFLKHSFAKKELLKNGEFELVANLQEAPYLKPFQNQKWKIVDGTDPSIIEKSMRMSWGDVVVKPVSGKKNVYKLTFTRTLTLRDGGEENKTLMVLASPVNTIDTTFSKQFDDYEQTIVKMKDEKIRLQAEADMVSSFRIRQMGVWNIDKIINKDELINISVKFDFEKDLDPFVNHIKLFVLYEEDNSVIYYLPQDWHKVKLSKTKRISLMAVLPGNRVAVVDAKDLKTKMQIGESEISFTTKIDDAANHLALK